MDGGIDRDIERIVQPQGGGCNGQRSQVNERKRSTPLFATTAMPALLSTPIATGPVPTFNMVTPVRLTASNTVTLFESNSRHGAARSRYQGRWQQALPDLLSLLDQTRLCIYCRNRVTLAVRNKKTMSRAPSHTAPAGRASTGTLVGAVDRTKLKTKAPV